jgi:hypothetical protein
VGKGRESALAQLRPRREPPSAWAAVAESGRGAQPAHSASNLIPSHFFGAPHSGEAAKRAGSMAAASVRGGASANARLPQAPDAGAIPVTVAARARRWCVEWCEIVSARLPQAPVAGAVPTTAMARVRGWPVAAACGGGRVGAYVHGCHRRRRRRGRALDGANWAGRRRVARVRRRVGSAAGARGAACGGARPRPLGARTRDCRGRR